MWPFKKEKQKPKWKIGFEMDDENTVSVAISVPVFSNEKEQEYVYTQLDLLLESILSPTACAQFIYNAASLNKESPIAQYVGNSIIKLLQKRKVELLTKVKNRGPVVKPSDLFKGNQQ